MKLIRLLILEDDIQTQSLLLRNLSALEKKLITSENKTEIAVTILSEYTQVEEYVNKMPQLHFDIILLDRDCKAGGSFHVLDFSKSDINKIISISSVPQYNEEAKKRGIRHVVYKDYGNLDIFSDEVAGLIEQLIFELIG